MGAFAGTIWDLWLNAFARNVSYANAAVWVKLHIGDPGAAGTANPAAATARMQATFASSSSGGSIANSALIEWTSLPNTETFTHISLWTSQTAGIWAGSDDLSSSAAVTAGDTFRIPAGSLVLSMT